MISGEGSVSSQSQPCYHTFFKANKYRSGSTPGSSTLFFAVLSTPHLNERIHVERFRWCHAEINRELKPFLRAVATCRSRENCAPSAGKDLAFFSSNKSGWEGSDLFRECNSQFDIVPWAANAAWSFLCYRRASIVRAQNYSGSLFTR